MIKLGMVKKFANILANLSLLFNSFLPLILAAQPAFAQSTDVTATPTEVVQTTPSPEVTPIIETTPTVEPTLEVTPQVTPETTPTITPETTPQITPEVTPEITVTPETTITPTSTSTPTNNNSDNNQNTSSSNSSDNSNNSNNQQPTATPTVTVTPAVLGQSVAKDDGSIETSVVPNDQSRTDLLNPNISTDKPDYHPAEIAIIKGSGFLTNTEYFLHITSDNLDQTYRIVSDANGEFIYSYQLENVYHPDYKVEIKDATGSVVASTTFTDTYSCTPYDDYGIRSSDGTDHHAVFDFHSDNQNVDISAEPGYTVSEVLLDLGAGFIHYGSSAGRYDPSGNTRIIQAKVHIIKTCSCGDGAVNNGETCDGNSQACTINGYAGTQSCNAGCNGWNTCVATQSCGDDTVNGPETCDGNPQSCKTNDNYNGTKSCKSDCSGWNNACVATESCGDGHKNGNEECDGTDGVGLHQICNNCKLTTLPYCGDGHKDTGLGENCDNGSSNTTSCSAEYGKTCDYCETGTCQTKTIIGPYCGDGAVTGDEQCDGSNLNGNSSDDFSCDRCKLNLLEPKVKICHATNSQTNPYGPKPEEPDKSADVSGHNGHNGPVWYDGITTSWGDIIPPFYYVGGYYAGKNWVDNPEGQAIWKNGCKASCTDADGDNICDFQDNCPSIANTDQRDSDNDKVGDVCDNCVSIANFGQQDDDRDGKGNACDSINNRCGDGAVFEDEECDDGNTVNTDLCSNDCKINVVCGDYVINGNEQCDDGNTEDGDGCDSTCKTEKKVDICHWDEGSNAYKKAQNVSYNSIYKWDNGKDECETKGHGLEPKDIIPSFTNDDCSYPGQNYSTENQAFLENGCETPTDVCPNIEGNQAEIPDGMVKDDSGNCVTAPVCGDGVVNQETEKCDGKDGVGDHQQCNDQCELENLPYCGDGIKNNDEQCDGEDGIEGRQTCNQECTINENIIPRFLISKINNTGGSELNPGNSVEYKITLNFQDNNVNNLKVTDLLSNGFKYRLGSYKVFKDGIDITFSLSIPEPQYHSPGVWDLTNLGEITPNNTIELVYTADISSDQQAGKYADLAYASANYAYDSEKSLLAEAQGDGYIDTNFVGTQVLVNKNTQNSVSAEVQQTNKVTGQVLGASTDELPGTGASTIWLIISTILAGLGLVFIKSGKITRLMAKKTLLIFLFTALNFGLLINPVLAETSSLSVRVEEPKTPSNTKDIQLKFVALDIQGRGVTAYCLKKGPSDSAFNQFSSETLTGANGNASHCSLSSAINNEGSYQFQVKTVAGGEEKLSNIVSLDYKTSTPGTPTDYRKEQINSCDFKIHFKTADDNGKTVKVELYRSSDSNFSANNESLVSSVNIGSNQEKDILNNVPDCSKTYYFALRAFDNAGNGSGLVGDKVYTTVTENGTVITSTSTNPTTGAIPVSGNVIPGEENQTGENITPSPSTENNGQVLGAENRGGQSFFARHKFFSAVIILAALAIIAYALKKIIQGKKRGSKKR